MLLEDAPVGPSQASLTLIENVSKNANPYSGGFKVTRLPGASFQLTVGYANLSPQESNWFDAFIADMRGGANISRIPDLSFTHPTGTGGAMSFSGAAVDGNTINSTGSAGQLLIGDRLSFIDAATGLEELHIVTSNMTSGTIEVSPELKRLVSGGTAINTANPGFSGILVNAKNTVARSGLAGSCTLVFQEALYGF